MTIERLVGVFVTDDSLYQKYREHMPPLLQSYGGEFGYDFKVSEVLKSKTADPINRVFTIFFTDENAMDTLFSDEKYLKIRKNTLIIWSHSAQSSQNTSANFFILHVVKIS